jgi:hypothetical protein
MHKIIKINEVGLAAAIALLGVTMAALIALLPMEKISGCREYALVFFSASAPLLSFSVSLELIVSKSGLLNFHTNTYIMLVGAACSLIGLTLSILAISNLAAATFVATALFVWLLSLYVVVKR